MYNCCPMRYLLMKSTLIHRISQDVADFLE